VTDDRANPDADPVRALREPLDRRTVLAAGGVASASAALLAVAGCASYSTGGGQQNAPTQSANNAGSTSLGPTSAVPVGGGTVFTSQKVVVTQPTSGTFHAFSAICTHQGCTVNSVSGGTINCPCHGSKYRITDGSVANGPATKPLPAKQVTVQDGQLRVT
jgi:Rieske Fe-S protein